MSLCFFHNSAQLPLLLLFLLVMTVHCLVCVMGSGSGQLFFFITRVGINTCFAPDCTDPNFKNTEPNTLSRCKYIFTFQIVLDETHWIEIFIIFLVSTCCMKTTLFSLDEQKWPEKFCYLMQREKIIHVCFSGFIFQGLLAFCWS